jgi:hypothetical protein
MNSLKRVRPVGFRLQIRGEGSTCRGRGGYRLKRGVTVDSKTPKHHAAPCSMSLHCAWRSRSALRRGARGAASVCMAEGRDRPVFRKRR